MCSNMCNSQDVLEGCGTFRTCRKHSLERERLRVVLYSYSLDLLVVSDL